MNNKSIPSASVLFVDDEDKARKYFALAMANDFNVKTAGSAAEALAILAENGQQIGIIVSDQRMPEQTGVELLKAVRDDYPHIVRLLTTAYTDLEDAIEAINRGEILRYIQKPWNIGALKTELTQAMNYFEIKNERDKLLEEKLSVKQRMVQIDRITQLLLIAESIPRLRFNAQAVRRYVDLLVTTTTLPSAKSASYESFRMDIWDQTLAETARMQHFARAITEQLGQHLPASPEFTTLADLPMLQSLLRHAAAASDIVMAEYVGNPAAVINVDLPLFKLLLDKLFSIINSLGNSAPSPAISIGIAAQEFQSAPALRISLEFAGTDSQQLHEILNGVVTKEIPAVCSDFLVALLACFHHGGSLDIKPDADRSSLILILPANPLLTLIAPGKSNWLANVLSAFEPEIQA